MSYFDPPFKASFKIGSSNFYISKPSITSYNHRLQLNYGIYNDYGEKVGSLYEINNGYFSNVFYSSRNSIYPPQEIGIARGNISAVDLLYNYLKKKW